jgi:hypothetical protein
MDERLAVEPELATLHALGFEAGLVLDVVVDAIEDDLARGAPREHEEALRCVGPSTFVSQVVAGRSGFRRTRSITPASAKALIEANLIRDPMSLTQPSTVPVAATWSYWP